MNSPTEAEFIDHWREMRPNVIDGFIKLKLVHAEGTSLLVPDLLAADLGGMRWFQPKFFYAPQLSFWEGYAAANIGIEVSGGPLVNVTFTSGGFVASLSDSSQVYRCMISAPGDLTVPCTITMPPAYPFPYRPHRSQRSSLRRPERDLGASAKRA